LYSINISIELNLKGLNMRFSGFKVTTAPAEEPVSVTEAKAQLRIDGSDNDTLITSLIKACRDEAERFMHRAFVTQTITMKLDSFPSTICPVRSPLISVTSIKYIDTAGSEQTLDSSYYTVDTYSEPARIVEAYGKTWPSTQSTINAVEVVYVAGWGAATAVPNAIKQGIISLVVDMFEHPELSSEVALKNNKSAQNIFNSYKLTEFV
jgi:uncharacterized phiE125 gp8 family phage protein